MLNLNSFRTLLPRWSFFAEPGYACVYSIREGKRRNNSLGQVQTIWAAWEPLWTPPPFRPWHLLVNPTSNHFAWIMSQTEEWRDVQAKSESHVIDPSGLKSLEPHLQSFIQAKAFAELWQLQLSLVSQSVGDDTTEIYDFGVRHAGQGLFDGT